MSLNQDTPPLFLEDSLYCLEEQWDDEDGDAVESSEACFRNNTCPMFKLPEEMLSDDDDDEYLKQLFLKEGKRATQMFHNIEKDQALVESRNGAVEWILKVQSFYSFRPLTAVLAVNYLDRFIFLSLQQSFQREKPWMTHLAAVACLSLAAKVEEVHVPLLLDLQVGETKYVFEAKTIQKMEILVLSALDWKMSPVNPLTFLDQFTSTLGWSSPIYGEFIQRCELVILLSLFDARSVSYPPSVMATASMFHVIGHLRPSICDQFKNQLAGILRINQENLNECSEYIRNMTSNSYHHLSMKRKFGSPRSPTGVMDASFSSDSSSSSWSATSSSVTSSPEPHSKRARIDHGHPHCASDESLVLSSV